VLFRSRQGFYGITPRSVVRTNWKLAFEDKLRRLGLLSEGLFGVSSSAQQHRSPIIRALAHSSFEFVQPQDVFLAVYVKKRSEARDLVLPTHVQGFADRLEQERHGENTRNRRRG
jgi:hypothetical protein